MLGVMSTDVRRRPKYLTRQIQRDATFIGLLRELDQASAAAIGDAVLLRWVVSAYDDAVRQRIRFGERLRSVLQSTTDPLGISEIQDVDAIVAASRSRVHPAPVPFLGPLHAEASMHELRMAALLEVVIARHPAWPWLTGVSGIGPVLAARLLSRLEIRRAPTPSSFWAYCGLATVPGTRYRCRRCGGVITGISGLTEAPHHRLADGTNCSSGPATVATGETVRIGQPRPRPGESRRFDSTARTACYLIGVSFARQGREYKALYTEHRLRLQTVHPEWPRKRIVLAAQRVGVKRFLADLWVEWRRREGLPIVPPYALRAERRLASSVFVGCA
jgi:hypothetical protein